LLPYRTLHSHFSLTAVAPTTALVAVVNTYLTPKINFIKIIKGHKKWNPGKGLILQILQKIFY
jgi:hypothetical protein